MTESLRIQKVYGSTLADYVSVLAQLRITIFREFPYLYDGDLAYEEKYLQTYVDSPQSMAVFVFDGMDAVAATTCIPLAHEVDELKKPFLDAGMDVNRIFYFGESIVLQKYRGRGLGVRFFEEREAHARASGDFEMVCFCAVERPANHPRRPANYQPLDGFWTRRGFTKQPTLQAQFPWKDLDDANETYKTMTFWTKALRP